MAGSRKTAVGPRWWREPSAIVSLGPGHAVGSGALKAWLSARVTASRYRLGAAGAGP